DYRAEPNPSRAELMLRQGEGFHATEAPRGLIFHRYRVGPDGLIAQARIVPPTSQNQGQIERDLAAFLPGVLDRADTEVATRCEHLIRNYDPCISCATHFLKVKIDRQ
ncbi:MAG TPA: nickel-dependent hydrogenase large subunit, partial [Gemmata sp.]|nr:nickel-dependent hydrogenase large subunit [Gemmata sp.]